jgi:transcriptional regulator with XRE-family HTH domain
LHDNVSTLPDMELRERMRLARAHAGIESQAELARRIRALGIPITTQSIQKIENGRSRNPRGTTLAGAAAVCGVRVEWLTNGDDPMVAADHKNVTAGDPNNLGRIHSVEGRGPDTTNAGQMQPQELELLPLKGTLAPFKRLPFYEASADEGGRMLVSTEPVNLLPVPSCLLNVPDGYAIRMAGSSMEPMYYPGTVLYVSPGKEPRRFAGVVVLLADGNAITIRQFLRRTPTGVVLRELGPDGRSRDFELPESEFIRIDTVVGTDNEA